MAYIEMKHSFKRYQVGDTKIVANNDISFEIEKGELVIILGASGAGKSTVLNILGGMDTNDEGDILIDGQNIADYNSHQLTDYRRNDVGFVFQFYNLVPDLTAKENVELASEIVKDAQDPVTVLDYNTGKQVLQILQDMSRNQGATVIIVTHNAALAPIADRVIRMHDARVKSVTVNEEPQDISTLEY